MELGENTHHIRRLSKEFAKEVYADSVKRCLLPAKCLLEMLLIWPGIDNKYITGVDWLNFINIMIVEILHAAFVIINRKDIVNALLVSATVTTTMEALVRVYIIISKKHILNDILHDIWKRFWPVAIMSKPKTRELTIKCYVMVGLTLGCFVPAIFCNAIITLWPYLANELVFKSVYPFQWNQTYVYEGLYLWQYFTEWYILIVVNVFDNFMVGIMAVCVAQLLVLQGVFKNILSNLSKHHRLVLFNEVISDTDMVRKCLDQQRMLIRICEQLAGILSFLMLMQFFNSTIALCASCIVLKLEPSQFIKMLTYAIAHMFQLFNYCYAGHELSTQSGEMAVAIYNCNWPVSVDDKLKKSVMFMIQRSQKLQVFKAGNITEVNLVSYVAVLRLSFSFYTLFNNLIDRKSVEQ